MRKRVDTSVATATVTSGPFLFRTRLNTARGKFDSLCLLLPVFLKKNRREELEKDAQNLPI